MKKYRRQLVGGHFYAYRTRKHTEILRSNYEFNPRDEDFFDETLRLKVIHSTTTDHIGKIVHIDRRALVRLNLWDTILLHLLGYSWKYKY